MARVVRRAQLLFHVMPRRAGRGRPAKNEEVSVSHWHRYVRSVIR